MVFSLKAHFLFTSTVLPASSGYFGHVGDGLESAVLQELTDFKAECKN